MYQGTSPFEYFQEDHTEVVVNNISGTLNDLTTLSLFAKCNYRTSNCDGTGRLKNVTTSVSPQFFVEEFPSDLNGTGGKLYSTKT